MRRTVLTAALALVALSAQATSWQVQALPTLNGASTLLVAGNAHGQYVGQAYTGPGLSVAVTFQQGVLQALDGFGDRSHAYAINNRGDLLVAVIDPRTGATTHSVLQTAEGARHRFQDVSGRPSYAKYLSPTGRAVGYAGTATGGQVAAVLDPNGSFQLLGTFGGKTSHPQAVSDNGWVVGTASANTPGGRGFLWQGNSLQDLGTLGGSTNTPRDVNSRGQVIGQSFNASNQGHAYLWDAGQIQLLSLGGSQGMAMALNEAGQVVGWSHTADGRQAGFLYENGQMQAVSLGGFSGSLYLLNEAGVAAGLATNELNQQRAIVHRNGQTLNLGTLGGSWSRALELNAQGQVLGESENAQAGRSLFLWDGERVVDLDLLALDAGFSDLSYASFAGDGSVFGHGLRNGRTESFLLVAAPVPEPAPWLLMAGGSLFLAARRLRRSAP